MVGARVGRQMLHRLYVYVSKRPIFAGRGALRAAPRDRNSSKNSSALLARLRARKHARNKPLRAGVSVAGAEPIISGMAGRYATALFDLALESNAVDTVKTDLDRFDALIAESADLERLVRSPVYGADEQEKAIGPVLDRAGIGGIAAKFVKLVTKNRRLFAVRDIVKAYRAMVARHKGEVTAQVTVAEALSDAHSASIQEALNSVTGKHVGLDVKVDPAIIGGLVVKLGSRMVDSSLRTKLNSIKNAMKEVG